MLRTAESFIYMSFFNPSQWLHDIGAIVNKGNWCVEKLLHS